MPACRPCDTISVMKQTFTYQITEQDQGRTIEQFLRLRGFSRRLLVRLRKTDHGICLGAGGETPVYTTKILSEGDLLTIRVPDDSPSGHIVPVKQEFTILYEDEDLMVIDKPAGMPVHPSQGNFYNTLANGVAWYFAQKGESFTFRAVNRLDRDTTGLLIIAKHLLSAALLSEMVAKKQICRQYLAAVSGKTEESGSVCAPIARADGSTIERCVDEERGEYACTHYQRLYYCPEKDCSLILLSLETGRTHQIRVHMKHIGHPLYGDFLYHPDYRFIGRQSLHSFRLSFSHPLTGKEMTFEARIPDDFSFAIPDGYSVSGGPALSDHPASSGCPDGQA